MLDQKQGVARYLQISFQTNHFPTIAWAASLTLRNFILTFDDSSYQNSTHLSLFLFLLKKKEINFAPTLKKDRQLLWITTAHLTISIPSLQSFQEPWPLQAALTKILPKPHLNLLSPNNYRAQNFTLSQGHVGSGTTFRDFWFLRLAKAGLSAEVTSGVSRAEATAHRAPHHPSLGTAGPAQPQARHKHLDQVSLSVGCGRGGTCGRLQASIVTLSEGVGENFMATDGSGVSPGGLREETWKA